MPIVDIAYCEHGNEREFCSLPHTVSAAPSPQKEINIMRRCRHNNYVSTCSDCCEGGPVIEGPLPVGFIP